MWFRALSCLVLASTLHAMPLAGSWEGFHTEANADEWWLFSYDDELAAPPLWTGPDEDENPYAYSFFLGGDAVWFFADGSTSGGGLIGDYASQKIAGVDVSVSIDPAEIDFIDLAIFADGPAGPDYYLSRIYEPADLGELPTWYDLNFSFDDDWYYFQGDDFIAFRPDAGFLASIREVGLRIFPVVGISPDSYVGIDDFILVPTVDAPALSTSLTGGGFLMEFIPNPGVAATIETFSSSGTWEPVEGRTDLTGPQSYSSPTAPGTRLFRVVTEEKLTPLVAP